MMGLDVFLGAGVFVLGLAMGLAVRGVWLMFGRDRTDAQQNRGFSLVLRATAILLLYAALAKVVLP